MAASELHLAEAVTVSGAEAEARSVGVRFAQALAAKDGDALLGLLTDPIDFQGLTPGRHWQTDGARSLVEDVLLGAWFTPADHIDQLLDVGVGAVGDRRHLSYRFALRNSEGAFTVEQQVYFLLEGAKISWMRVLCSGFRAS